MTQNSIVLCDTVASAARQLAMVASRQHDETYTRAYVDALSDLLGVLSITPAVGPAVGDWRVESPTLALDKLTDMR